MTCRVLQAFSFGGSSGGFGQPQSNPFLFGGSSAPAFGASGAPPVSPFGASSTPAFGASTPSFGGFGAASSGGFGAASPASEQTRDWGRPEAISSVSALPANPDYTRESCNAATSPSRMSRAVQAGRITLLQSAALTAKLQSDVVPCRSFWGSILECLQLWSQPQPLWSPQQCAQPLWGLLCGLWRSGSLRRPLRVSPQIWCRRRPSLHAPASLGMHAGITVSV